jgi:hypothetical protein
LGAATGAATGAGAGTATDSSVFFTTFLEDLAEEAFIILLEEVETEDILRTGLTLAFDGQINFLLIQMPEQNIFSTAFSFFLKCVIK